MTPIHTADHTPRAHEWEMVTAFVMTMPENRADPGECMLKPVAEELMGYGLQEAFLHEVCAAVEQTGKEMRESCPAGSLDSINVRILISHQAIRGGNARLPWQFYTLRQIASSESDNLETIENPCGYIDVHVYQ
jgi:hypothetical protein